MTVNSTVSSAIYMGDGVSTVFPVPFYFLADSHLSVTLVNVDSKATATAVLNTDYSVTGAGIQGGGSITMLTGAPAANIRVLIFRDIPIDQQVDYTPNDKFPAEVTEQALDKITMILQEIAARETSSIRYALSEYGTDGTLPIAPNRASTVLGFDANGAQTLLPIPASVGAGDLKNEAWTAGTDYTAGTSNSVTLSRAYTSKANLGTVVMAGVAQDPATYSLSGTTLTFLDGVGAPVAIPAYVNRIWCYGGTTISLSEPATGSVTDASIATGSKLSSRINNSVSITDPAFGGVVGTDCTTAFGLAIAYLVAQGGGQLTLPAGLFILSAKAVCNLPGTGISSISIQGAGADITELRWTNADGGLRFNLNSPGHTVHVRDVSITTSHAGGGTGVYISQAMSLNTFMQSDIAFVTFRGSDNGGAGGNAYWNDCCIMNGVCGTNVLGVTCYGPNSWSVAAARGFTYQGNADTRLSAPAGNGYSIYHNISMAIFNGLNIGIIYGDYAQGLTINQINCQNTQTGFFCPPGSTGNLAQLQIATSQFADNGNDISIFSPILNTMIYGNNLISHNANSAIFLSDPDGFSIVGNQIISDGSSPSNIGVAVGASTGGFNTGIITGNSFINLGTAVLLQAGSSGVNVQSNSYQGNTTTVANLGTGNTVGGGSQ